MEILRNFYKNYDKCWKFKKKFVEILKVEIMRNLKNILLEKILRKKFYWDIFAEIMIILCAHSEEDMRYF